MSGNYDDIIEEDDDDMSMLLESVQIKDVAGSSVGMAGTAQISNAITASPPLSPSGNRGGGAGSAVAPPPSMQNRRNVTMEEVRMWTILYPCYFDPKLKIKKGRRLPIEKCKGCEGADINDVVEACHKLELACVWTPKRHPAVDFMRRGRVHVEIFRPTPAGSSSAAAAAAGEGAPLRQAIKPHLDSKLKLMEAIAREIPNLPGRPIRHAHVAKIQAEHDARRAKLKGKARKTPTAGTLTTTGGGGEKESKKEKGSGKR
jgi:signal recognition particle subunit SRP19